MELITISQKMLLAAKTKAPVEEYVSMLKMISERDLIDQLTSDNLRKSFWINVYNAFTQIILSADPDRYKNRNSFFTDHQIIIAHKKLSLDDIEHGILRRSKVKWGFGYLNKWFPSRFEKTLRVHHLDFRIHFALNCGARSCPPIAFYGPEKIDAQLDLAMKSYLQGEVDYDESNDLVFLPAIMNWFINDFRGRKGIRALLKEMSIVPPQKDPLIRFKKYDWDLFLLNYKTE